MKRKKWSDEEVNHLTRLVKSGLSLREIAKELNRPYSSVHAKCQRLNLPGKLQVKKWTVLETELMFTMMEEGKTYREVADRLGRTYVSVYDKYNYSKL